MSVNNYSLLTDFISKVYITYFKNYHQTTTLTYYPTNQMMWIQHTFLKFQSSLASHIKYCFSFNVFFIIRYNEFVCVSKCFMVAANYWWQLNIHYISFVNLNGHLRMKRKKVLINVYVINVESFVDLCFQRLGNNVGLQMEIQVYST